MNVIGYTALGAIQIEMDGVEMFVPDDMGNPQRQMIAEWEVAGGVIPAYEHPAPAPEQVIEQFRAAIQAHVDAAAISRRYDSGNSLATYVASSNPDWAAEAHAFVIWRDAVWAYAYVEMDRVLGGLREKPTVQEFLDELPVMDWVD